MDEGEEVEVDEVEAAASGVEVDIESELVQEVACVDAQQMAARLVLSSSDPRRDPESNSNPNPNMVVHVPSVIADEAADDDAEDVLAVDVNGTTLGEMWVPLELRCALSLQRLTDPAKGEGCTHAPRCNYEQLRSYVGRLLGHCGTKACPIAGCSARLQRTRGVLRDDWLREQLTRVPRHVETVWLRGDELRMHPPGVSHTARHAPKRKRRRDGSDARAPPTARRRVRQRARGQGREPIVLD